MKHSETHSPASSYIGHVKNGVVVFDAHISLQDGQAVRVEPLSEAPGSPIGPERAQQLRHLQQLFAEWTEEDGRLSEEEADRLRTTLEDSRGLRFGSPDLP